MDYLFASKAEIYRQVVNLFVDIVEDIRKNGSPGYIPMRPTEVRDATTGLQSHMDDCPALGQIVGVADLFFTGHRQSRSFPSTDELESLRQAAFRAIDDRILEGAALPNHAADHLDEKDLRILQAVYDAGATPESGKRTTYEAIAPVVMSFHEASKQDVDRKGKRLVELGLLASQVGRGGGIWLTEGGVKRCKSGKSN